MGNTFTTQKESVVPTITPSSKPDPLVAVEAPILSFTVDEFVFAYLQGVRTKCMFHKTGRPFLEDAVYHPPWVGTTAEDMYDEMIGVGISPLAWCQANLPELMLKDSFITRVAPIEDEEPNINYKGMSFSHWSFLQTLNEADTELRSVIPSAHPTVNKPIPDRFALPQAWCVGMHELAAMLDEMHNAGITPYQYVAGTPMLLDYSSTSPFMVCMEMDTSLRLPELQIAFRNRWIVQYMMDCLGLIWNHVDDPAKHPLCHVFVRIPVLSEPIWFAHVRPMLAQSKRDFVRSLPAIDVDSIAKEDMRCPHCWGNFDEEDEDGKRDSPVHAPCPFGHVYGRSCLLELMLHMEQEMLCPLCRKEWRI